MLLWPLQKLVWLARTKNQPSLEVTQRTVAAFTPRHTAIATCTLVPPNLRLHCNALLSPIRALHNQLSISPLRGLLPDENAAQKPHPQLQHPSRPPNRTQHHQNQHLLMSRFVIGRQIDPHLLRCTCSTCLQSCPWEDNRSEVHWVPSLALRGCRTPFLAELGSTRARRRPFHCSTFSFIQRLSCPM